MWKGVDIIEGEICPAPICLLLRIPPNRKKHCGNITVHKKQIKRDKEADRLSIFDPGVKKCTAARPINNAPVRGQ